MLPPIWRSAFQRPGATFWVLSQAVDRFASKAARGEGSAATGVSTTRRGLRPTNSRKTVVGYMLLIEALLRNQNALLIEPSSRLTA